MLYGCMRITQRIIAKVHYLWFWHFNGHNSNNGCFEKCSHNVKPFRISLNRLYLFLLAKIEWSIVSKHFILISFDCTQKLSLGYYSEYLFKILNCSLFLKNDGKRYRFLIFEDSSHSMSRIFSCPKMVNKWEK